MIMLLHAADRLDSFAPSYIPYSIHEADPIDHIAVPVHRMWE